MARDTGSGTAQNLESGEAGAGMEPRQNRCRVPEQIDPAPRRIPGQAPETVNLRDLHGSRANPASGRDRAGAEPGQDRIPGMKSIIVLMNNKPLKNNLL